MAACGAGKQVGKTGAAKPITFAGTAVRNHSSSRSVHTIGGLDLQEPMPIGGQGEWPATLPANLLNDETDSK